jgi:hypothetical protein
MKTDIYLISSNLYLEYVFSQCEINYNITNIKSFQEFYHLFHSISLPIIICENYEDFSHFKNTIFKEKLIFLSSSQDYQYKYILTKPYKVTDLLSLVANLSYKEIFRINESVLFFYNQLEIVRDNRSKISLTFIEAELLYLIITNNYSSSKLFLTSKIWPSYTSSQVSKNLDNYIYKLRKKLECFNLYLDSDTNLYHLRNG